MEFDADAGGGDVDDALELQSRRYSNDSRRVIHVVPILICVLRRLWLLSALVLLLTLLSCRLCVAVAAGH